MKFSTVWDYNYWMDSNGFFVGFNSPDALKGEKTHGLPPYAKRTGYLVDEYPACPKDWMRSEGKTTSYFVPVQEDKGMWLDFNKNTDRKYHVAILISVQGVNPITGLPCNDAHLEQYSETCPKCKDKFGPNRFCKKCGYKWPKQNYISTTGTPNGQLWLDGFRSAQGVVRQYILTQEKMKGVASNIIGKDRVYAVGISFFLSKNPKPVVEQPKDVRLGGLITYGQPQFYSPVSTPINWKIKSKSINVNHTTFGSSLGEDNDAVKGSISTNSYKCGKSVKTIKSSKGGGASAGDMDNYVVENQLETNSSVGDIVEKQIESPNLVMGNYVRGAVKSISPVDVSKVEVGAGENIDQTVWDDPEPLDYWRSEPEAITLINYCLEEECAKIIKAGKVSLEGHKEGFLNKIPVGNSKE